MHDMEIESEESEDEIVDEDVNVKQANSQKKKGGMFSLFK